MLSVLGLKGPPPPLIVMLADAIGLQPGCGEGLGLGESPGLGDALGLGEGLKLGDGLGEGDGLACPWALSALKELRSAIVTAIAAFRRVCVIIVPG